MGSDSILIPAHSPSFSSKYPHKIQIKLVNRPAKTVLIEYRDGRRNGDVIAQLKQHYHVSRRFNNPKIRVIFKNGILTEMADKLSRHGIEVIGTKVDKENEEFRGKWNEAMMEKLMEENDSEWEDGEDGREEEERDIMRLSEAKNHRNGTNPSLNLDISAVMLLVTNLCEPGGADYEFEEPMLNCHVADERVEKAKGPLLEKLRGCQLIMSEAAFQRVSEIISTVGGPTEQKRFSEFLPQIERIPDQASNEVGRVAKIRDIKGVSEVTKRVFSCGEYTGTTTVTANRKFLGLSQRKNSHPRGADCGWLYYSESNGYLF
uniref:DUF1308 domain-containing protein n=1 Tax=Caenorhabditis japonica TaxID=281687 RepID=A0A8R1E4V5_CAEJA